MFCLDIVIVKIGLLKKKYRVILKGHIKILKLLILYNYLNYFSVIKIIQEFSLLYYLKL